MNKKRFIFGIVTILFLILSYFTTRPDGKLHVVFCNVGQGDGAYIRTPAGQDILIDGGPDNKILTCLGRHMPFYDRTIDLVILTHPQDDHMGGLLEVLKRFKVDYFATGPMDNLLSDKYRELKDIVKKKGITVRNLYTGEKIALGEVKLDALWPQREWLAENIDEKSIDENVLGAATSLEDLNYFSVILNLNYGDLDVLFTGDADSRIQDKIMARVDLPDIDILKFPHHGSRYGVTDEFLNKVKPETAVISVGKNPWGHPTQEALEILREKDIKILRTDKEGDIEIMR